MSVNDVHDAAKPVPKTTAADIVCRRVLCITRHAAAVAAAGQTRRRAPRRLPRMRTRDVPNVLAGVQWKHPFVQYGGLRLGCATTLREQRMACDRAAASCDLR